MKFIVLVLLIISILFVVGCIQTIDSEPTDPEPTQQQEPTCTTNWGCSSWSECNPSGFQSRSCTDSNGCGTIDDRPAISQPCKYVQQCVESWGCSSWSVCVQPGTQSRICRDSNSCGTIKDRPTITQTCDYVKSCVEDWGCSTWGSCTSQNEQKRTCTDSNGCGSTNDKPATTQTCTYTSPCVEDWSCSSWSECNPSGYQSRTCADSNSCGTTKYKPTTTQSCTYTSPCVEDWSCYSWSTCVNEQETRICSDANHCGTELDKPENNRACFEEVTDPPICDQDNRCEWYDGETIGSCPEDCIGDSNFFSGQTCTWRSDCGSSYTEYPYCIVNMCAKPTQTLIEFIRSNYQIGDCHNTPCDNCQHGTFHPTGVEYYGFQINFCTECNNNIFPCNEGYVCDKGLCVPE